jgi:glycosyltransferase involved in cell wall biosynthesis
MKKKKRILCTVTNDLSYDQRMQRICSTLAEAGYAVTLIGRKLPNSKPLEELPFEQKRLYCYFKKGKLFYLEYNLRLFFFLLFARMDLVCAVDLDTLLAGAWACFWRRKSYVYDAHEYFTELPEVVERPKVQAIWALVAKSCIPKAKGAYTVCNSLAQIFEKEYQKAFAVVRNVPFPKALNQGNKEVKAPYILIYQGALNEGRGLEEAIEAMQSFDKAEVQLWLVGEGDLSNLLRQMTKDLKVEDRVKFWGYILPSELKNITPQADIGLNLLKNKGLNYYYSLANKFFDYVQAEKPSLNMAFPEYQQHQQGYEVSLLLEELSPEAIVQSLNQLFEEPDLYQKLQANCRNAKLDWHWEKEKKVLIDFYKEILD